MASEILAAIALDKIIAQLSDLLTSKEPPCLNVKFCIIGLTKQSSLYPNGERSAVIQRAIADPIKPHHCIVQLPRYLHVSGQLSLKVTTGNIDETRLSGDAFDLVTFFLNMDKD